MLFRKSGVYIACVAALALVSPAVSGQTDKPSYVTLIKKRVATIDAGKAILESRDTDVEAQIPETRNPFVAWKPKYVPPPTTDLGSDEPPPPPPPDPPIADDVVVKAVANQMNPTGALVAGEKAILMFANGGRLSVGSAVPATIKGRTYKVIVSRITAGDFTLQLNDAEFTKKLAKGGKGSIKIN